MCVCLCRETRDVTLSKRQKSLIGLELTIRARQTGLESSSLWIFGARIPSIDRHTWLFLNLDSRGWTQIITKLFPQLKANILNWVDHEWAISFYRIAFHKLIKDKWHKILPPPQKKVKASDLTTPSGQSVITKSLGTGKLDMAKQESSDDWSLL